MARTNAQRNIQALAVVLIVAACFAIGLYGGELAAAAASESVTFVSSSSTGGTGTVTIRVLTTVDGETVVDHYEERSSGSGDVTVRVEDSKVTVDGTVTASGKVSRDEVEGVSAEGAQTQAEPGADFYELVELWRAGSAAEAGVYSNFNNLIKSYVRAAFSA